MHIVSGTATTDNDGSALIHYGVTFSSIPVVCANADSWTPTAVSLAGITKDSVTLRSLANKTLDWIACGQV